MHPIFETTAPALIVEMVKAKNSSLADMVVADISIGAPSENTNGAMDRNTVVTVTRVNEDLPMRESEQVFYDRVDISDLFTDFTVGTDYDAARLAALNVTGPDDVGLVIANLNARFDINLTSDDFDFVMTEQGGQPMTTTISAKASSLKFIGELALNHQPLD